MWILSLALSKASDPVDWSALCLVLSEHGVSSHMVWILQKLCFSQHEEVASLDQEGTAVLFKSTQACDKDACLVRQNCEDGRKDVRLDLILVMACHHFWISDLQMISSRSPHEIMTLLDKLVQFLGDAGRKLNAEKTVLITTQALPPPFLTTSTGAVIKVMQKESGHKWLGCMLSAAGSKNSTLDIGYHLQSASRVFFANK